MSDYWQGASNNVIGFNNTGENGEFKFYEVGEVFFQIQGTRATGVITVSATANADIPIGTLFDRDGVATTMLRTTAAATVPANGSVNIPVEAVSPGATGNNIPNNATFTLEEAITGVSDSATVQTAFSGGTGEGLVTPDWDEIWTWITGIDGSDTPQEQAIHNALAANSVFLGEFSSKNTQQRTGTATPAPQPDTSTSSTATRMTCWKLPASRLVSPPKLTTIVGLAQSSPSKTFMTFSRLTAGMR